LKPKTTSATGELQCTFPRAPVQTIARASGGFVLLTIEPATPGVKGKPQVEVSVTIKPTESSLAYDGKACRLTAAPKPPPQMKFDYQGLAATFSTVAGTWTVTFSGTSCGGDVHEPWAMTQTLMLNGAPVGQPGLRLVDLTSGSGGFTILKNSDGSGAADVQFQISGSTIAMAIALSGNYTGLALGQPQAQVTSTPVTSC
jgi:hypothetical protein